MADLKNVEIRNGYMDLVTTGTGTTPLEDGDGAATFYEEGSWTPALTFGSGSTGITYSTQGGFYIKMGKFVYAYGRIDLSDKGSSTGRAEIGGLPYANSSVSSVSHGGSFLSDVDNVSGFDTGTPVLDAAKGTSDIDMRFSTATGQSSIDDTNFTNTTKLIFHIIYET